MLNKRLYQITEDEAREILILLKLGLSFDVNIDNFKIWLNYEYKKLITRESKLRLSYDPLCFIGQPEPVQFVITESSGDTSSSTWCSTEASGINILMQVVSKEDYCILTS